MDGILRGEGAWQDTIERAVRAASRPIQIDPRFAPRPAPPGEHVATATADAPRFDRSTMPTARAAAALLLVYPLADGELAIPLTVRHADLRSHAGEVSLPGGAVDPKDASPEAAALREAWEEIGVPPDAVRVAGTLDGIWIPVSNYELRTIVGTAAGRPSLQLQAEEVASIVELPLRHLLGADAVTEELIEGPGWRLRAGVLRYGGERIWGATARSLAMFMAVLAEAGVAPNRSG